MGDSVEANGYEVGMSDDEFVENVEINIEDVVTDMGIQIANLTIENAKLRAALKLLRKNQQQGVGQ